jgi:hypothetical protein
MTLRSRSFRKRRAALVGLGAGVGLLVVAAASAAADGPGLTGVVNANQKAVGITVPTALAPGWQQVEVARGSMRLENGTAAVPYYGYDGDGPLVPAPGALPSAGPPVKKVEATKTEPDKNTYLVLDGQHGADPSYDYGRHFVFQGHEGGAPGEITRVNLDADLAHRVTLLATSTADGEPLPDIDGSTWDPWAERLLFTVEEGSEGEVLQATLDVPSKVEDLTGSIGHGGFEGIQNDSDGNLWIVEDVGGPAGTVNKAAKQPNSFVYRFVPNDPGDLVEGKLQVLQVLDSSGQPITFHVGQADADITSTAERALYTYGNSFTTKWITIHDNDVDGWDPFDANALAKAKGGTPMKRPENGVFRPGTDFTEFFFTATGDTSATSEANADFGGWGGIFRLTQSSPSADTGTLSLFYRGDQAHTGLDNVTFLSGRQLIAVEDAGDTLHAQRNALDSAYVFDTETDYGAAGADLPIRVIAEGRDPSATLDSQFLALPSPSGFQNEGDNELTGIHVSNGDPTADGILGAQVPDALASETWRLFYTAQHGDNITWEITPTRR